MFTKHTIILIYVLIIIILKLKRKINKEGLYREIAIVYL